MQRYGTRFDLQGERLGHVVDRDGHTHATIEWNEHGMARLTVPGASVDGAVIADELLGDAHAIFTEGNERATTMSAIDWAAPTEIPAIAAPGQLRGAGSALMNAIAQLAQHAGIAQLHYAGPYPSDTLYDTLRRSFRTTATQGEFTASFFDRAAKLSRDPMPFAFIPAPHERINVNGGHVEMRDGLERAVLDGIAFARLPNDQPTKRLVNASDEYPAAANVQPHRVHAEVWFGDAMYCRVATFDTGGALLDGPHAPPVYQSAVLGVAFPQSLVDALADLCARCVAAPLAAASRAFVAAHPFIWADLGVRAAARVGDELRVHAALWDRVAPLGAQRLILAILDELVPLVTQGATAMLAAAQR
ncbi:hypothetical protein BH11MYX2_BH11MYX2_20310 [soil metagenome]